MQSIHVLWLAMVPITRLEAPFDYACLSISFVLLMMISSVFYMLVPFDHPVISICLVDDTDIIKQISRSTDDPNSMIIIIIIISLLWLWFFSWNQTLCISKSWSSVSHVIFGNQEWWWNNLLSTNGVLMLSTGEHVAT